MNKFSNQISLLIASLIRNVGGKLGYFLRRIFYTKILGSCGKNLRIEEGVIIQGAKDIFLGSNVWIDKSVILMAGKCTTPEANTKIVKNKNRQCNLGELFIGSNSHIGAQCIIQAHGGVFIANDFTSSAGCKIYSLSNDVENCYEGTHFGKNISYILSDIYIGKNVWLGLNVIVLRGGVDNNSFVCPNSVVLSSFEENSFITGFPAKKIKNRFLHYDSEIVK